MHRTCPWTGTAALCAALLSSGPTRAADPPDTPAMVEKPGWLARTFGAKPKPTPAPAPPAARVLPNPAEVAANQRGDEEATYLRRVAVCDRLRAVAADTHDDALMRKADDLSEKAWQIYLKRTAHLPSARVKAEGDLDDALGTADTGRLATSRPARPAIASTVGREVKP
jgi:hypothetical protein